LKVIGLIIIALALAACAAPAPVEQPTPQIIKVEVPGPQPTPQIIPQTPKVCVDAINGLNEIIQAENDILMTLNDGNEMTQKQVDALTSLDTEQVYSDSAECVSTYGELGATS
jgi:hypothetical protein